MILSLKTYVIVALLVVSTYGGATENTKKNNQWLGPEVTLPPNSPNVDYNTTAEKKRTISNNDLIIKNEIADLRKTVARTKKLLEEWERNVKNFDQLALCAALENVRANIKKLDNKSVKENKEAFDAYVLLESQFRQDVETKKISCTK